ncbi:MAG: DUF58 domain-containing protein [Meiothermus sp.]|nr:DUF58 domain-containing protein [Meiothermus sp.]
MLARFRRPRKTAITVTVPAVTAPAQPLRPRELAAELMRKLEFKILKRLDGFLFGDYTGFFYGPSLDLAEVREYQPGDEVRRIDWNVTARTGKIHVRQYREEKEVTAWLIVDLSASMNFGTRRVLKREEALEFVGTAASIITRHGDKVGVIGFNEAGLRIVPPRAGKQQVLRILLELFALSQAAERRLAGREAGGRREERETVKNPNPQAPDHGPSGSLEAALEHISKTLKRRGLLFVVSDFLSVNSAEEPPWSRGLRRLAFRHDVIAVRVVDPAERELPQAGELRLRDPESGEEIWLDTSDPRVRRSHAALVQQREDMLARVLRSAQVDTLTLTTAQEIIEPILKFTLRRKGRR